MKLSPSYRELIGKAIDLGVKKSLLAKIFEVSRKTISKWNKRRKHLKDRKRKVKKSKITFEVEASIIAIRNFFAWGTARIQQALISLPEFTKEVFPNLVQGVNLSRAAINNVLKKHKINGYKRKPKEWKFFRAKAPNELWQIDLKGPFTLQGEKLWFLAVIDDYSRYLVLTHYFKHTPTSKNITDLLDTLPTKPKKILADNGPQFRKLWAKWCKQNCIEPIWAHPYYPQDKGKVERVIRTLTEEFINLTKKMPKWLTKLKEYTEWYNEKRFHRGIKTTPHKLYKLVGT